MERTKYLPLVFLLISLQSLAHKTNDLGIYKAYVSGKMTDWKNIIDKKEKEKKQTIDYLMELVNYQYGYIAYCIGVDKDDEAEKYLELAESNLKKAETLGAKKEIIYSYKSAFIGFEIGLSPYKAPIIGFNSLDYSEKALKLNSQSPIVLINYANVMYYMPSVFGGDKNMAIKKLLEAKKIMEADSTLVKSNWLYLNLLTLIGKSYQDLGNIKMAKYYYDYALKKEPNFTFVKTKLLPSLKD